MVQWKSKLRIRMMISYVGVSVMIVLLLEMLCAGGVLLVTALTTGLTTGFTSFVSMFLPVAIALLLLTIPLSAALGLITSRGIIQRMQRLVDVTSLIAEGHYEQRIPLTGAHGDAMLELFERQFNLVATQLMESIEQRHVLAEQNARMAERARIFRDLHDSVKQQVFALTMQLSTAHALIDAQPSVAGTHLQHAETLAYQVQQELTELIHSSRPSALGEKGLTVALQDYIELWSRQQHISVQRHIDRCSLPSPLEEALLRITQEALSNIARHSGASSVIYDLRCHQDMVTLVIEDNGVGFDPDDPDIAMKNGLGLRSMRERIEALHGTFAIESKGGNGTRVVARCPYTQFQDDTKMGTSATPLLVDEKRR
jgi:two-component system, NarL family, sensor histidine kinase LiaS